MTENFAYSLQSLYMRFTNFTKLIFKPPMPIKFDHHGIQHHNTVMSQINRVIRTIRLMESDSRCCGILSENQ